MDNRFNTIQGLVGTQGYWAYTHIFTANGPSDVNDFGLDIRNMRLGSGAGLITAQVKLSVPLYKLVGLELESGAFWSAKKRAGAKYNGYRSRWNAYISYYETPSSSDRFCLCKIRRFL